MLPLKTRPLTWSVLKKTLYNIQQLRLLTTPASLYEQNGGWVPQLKRETMLEIEQIWKPKLEGYDSNRQPTAQTKIGGKFYVLSMFPYPSGKLHMGHVRVYTISDMMARYHRMLGHEVIHPMGFDAFGLPAENAAIERNLHPKDWTYSNISTMKSQLKNLCCDFDWDKEVITCDPSYYKWTQYIFLKMYEAGLVYQREASVNWDPVDQTVLADEQIDNEGHSWRSGAVVEKRYLRQWYIRTTAYAQSLLDGLDTVRSDLWKDVVHLQRHWIGECTGCRLDFTLQVGEESDSLPIFTRNPEAIYGISHIALSASHRYNQPRYYKQKADVATSEIELTIQAIHPLTGELLPVVISEMSQENMEPNDCHIGIPSLSDVDRSTAELHGFPWQQIYSGTEDSPVLINSQQLDGLSIAEAAENIMKVTREQGIGGHPVSAKLRDWLISRQRYWGTPIPIIHCPTCKAVPVSFEDLPVALPESEDSSVAKGQTALLENQEWLNVKCPKCGGEARRETDTMDTFVDSAWYFLRYLDCNNDTKPLSSKQANTFMPVDLYIGGIEHAYLHLYYARFFNHFLCDIGMTSHREPFVNLLTQGMVKGESYKVARTGEYIPASQVEKKGGKPVEKGTGETVIVRYEKMSKSKHNGVDPEDLLSMYGADMTRLCILSNVAPKSDRNWNNEVYVGVQKWLNKVWYLVGTLVNHSASPEDVSQEQIDLWDQKIKSLRNTYLMEIQYHMNKTFLFNAAISRLHELTSELKKVPADVAVFSGQYRRAVQELVTVIGPFAPMFSMECWSVLQTIGETAADEIGNVLEQPWPVVDSDAEYYIKVTCNGVPIGHVPLDLDIFQQLNEENIVNLVQQEDFYLNTIQDHEVVKHDVHIREGWNANINITVPGITLEDPTDKKKKSKGKKEKRDKTEIESSEFDQ